jgi:hypothetical protein
MEERSCCLVSAPRLTQIGARCTVRVDRATGLPTDIIIQVLDLRLGGIAQIQNLNGQPPQPGDASTRFREALAPAPCACQRLLGDRSFDDGFVSTTGALVQVTARTAAKITP